MTGTMPLDGLRVIDLTRGTVGPFCTRLLGDYGADVVKIEPPDGDPSRHVPPFFEDEPGPERSGLFLFLNTNKRSVVLDLKTDEGRAHLLRLVQDADAVIENFQPGTLDRLGIGYDVLSEVNPMVVLTSLTNFGQDGPYRDYEATDLTIFGMGGNLQSAGDHDLGPVKTAGRMTGYHGGYVGALATMVALHGSQGARRGRARRPRALRDGDALDRRAARAAHGPPVHGPHRAAIGPGLAGRVGRVPVPRRVLHHQLGSLTPARRDPHDRPRRPPRAPRLVHRRGALRARAHRGVHRPPPAVDAGTHQGAVAPGVRGLRCPRGPHQHHRGPAQGSELRRARVLPHHRPPGDGPAHLPRLPLHAAPRGGAHAGAAARPAARRAHRGGARRDARTTRPRRALELRAHAVADADHRPPPA